MVGSRATDRETADEGPKVLLMGSPNVGKSAVFSRLTGARVIASNYPGTTVTFTEGRIKLDDRLCKVVDVPGTYTLEPTTPAEEVAVEMLKSGDIVVNVVDATNLERNLNLTLQLLRRSVPMVVALNMWDEALEHGIGIDVEGLQRRLGVPVVPTCAISGEGMKNLQESLRAARPGGLEYEDADRWHIIGGIIDDVQKVQHRHPTIGQSLGHATVHPVLGPIFALVVMVISFEVVRLVGEGLIGHVADPLFERLWLPVMERVSELLGSAGLIHDLLVGQLVDGTISFGESFGVLTTGLYIPFAAVLPYVFAFYLVLGILEDSGYLPRLGVLVDNVMHRIGLHGLSVVPFMLGLGCNVPGALALRVLETRKERFIAATLLSICVPCMAQLAMIAGLLGKHGAGGFALVFGTLFLLWVGLGSVLKRLTSGTTPEILVDIPPYRLPYWRALVQKLWMRMRGFLKEAVPYVLLGVLIVNLLHSLGIIGLLSTAFEPVTSRILGLPVEAAGALLVGFLRKDVAVGMLAPLNLSLKQLVVASVVLTAYFPCVATFIVLFRELGARDLLKATVIMVLAALSAGGLLNLLMTGLGL
ncbi:MAG: ferrous iron transporter B [Candidatus Brocadiae bacterium]|nr:ferrous iron transporter B [Candidatus Brocadiia bacterium]